MPSSSASRATRACSPSARRRRPPSARPTPHPGPGHGGQPRRSAAAPGHVPAATWRVADPRAGVRRRGGRARARGRAASASASASWRCSPAAATPRRSCVHHGSVLPVPDAMSDEEAGAFPEVFLTAFSNLFMPGLGALAAGESALVHGGGGGVGTAAIVAAARGGPPLLSSPWAAPRRRARCLALGATAAIDYRTRGLRRRASPS